MTSLTTSVKQGALEIHIFATFTSQHLSLLVKWCFYYLLLLGCLGMIPMNSLVIIGLRSVFQIIPGLSPFHHFQVEEVHFLQVSWCWLGQNVQVTKHNPIQSDFAWALTLFNKWHTQALALYITNVSTSKSGSNKSCGNGCSAAFLCWPLESHQLRCELIFGRKMKDQEGCCFMLHQCTWMHLVRTHSLSQFQHENLLSTRSVWASKALWFVSRILRSEVAIVKSALRLSQAMLLLSQHAFTIIYILLWI